MALRLRLELGKKAVFFTFVACIFLSLLVFSSVVGNNYKLRQKSFAIETRIYTMNGFISSLEEDIGRGAYIAGFRSLISLENSVVSTGIYLSNLSSTFEELFFNGTINGTNSSFVWNNTFSDWMEKIKDEAEKVDILLNFTVNDISISQDNPWNVRIDVDIDILMTDRESIVKWNKNKLITSYLELEGFEDPLYMLGTNGVVENKIRRGNFSYFVNGADISNLLNHTYEGYYTAFSGAPSYLMRLEGNFGESEYGIESLVDVAELVGKGVSPKDKSIVDYIYFGTENPVKYHVSGAPSWFKLDNSSNINNSLGHYDLYEVSGLV
ncbi:hypothetical protein GOV06_05465 [Candidatus Woesearchaeota archaeon]|nr:hypothetical protein [Candidatus Woesearchaeota archaeon]